MLTFGQSEIENFVSVNFDWLFFGETGGKSGTEHQIILAGFV